MSWIPPVVADLSAEVHENTGITPVTERITPTLWRVTIENARVKNVIEFKQTSGGRWTWKKSILLVDGEPHPTVDTHEKYYDLLLNTDAVLAREREEAAEAPHSHSHTHSH